MVMLLVVVNQLLAQIVQENEAAVVYYMPKTELVVTLHYDCVTQQPGMFYQYAQRYLGATDIITESQTTYHLTNLALSTQTVADTQRAYKVTAEKGYKLHLLSLNQDGILLGYNMSKPVSASSPAPHSITTAHPTSYTTPVLPLLEEQFMASSIAKMAEGAAKQIYRIRETRLNILAGDVEHVPADGQAMQLVLDELAKQEQELKALKGELNNINFGSQIRSYVMHPYSMVKDHRTNCETSNVSKVLDGYLDDFINEYLIKG
jgi:hypothetical protein